MKVDDLFFSLFFGLNSNWAGVLLYLILKSSLHQISIGCLAFWCVISPLLVHISPRWVVAGVVAVADTGGCNGFSCNPSLRAPN